MSLRESETSRPRRSPPAKPTETKDQRKRRLAKEKHARERLRARFAEDDDAVLTFKEFCAAISVSERQGRDILRSGNGPRVTRLSERRIGITRANLRTWLEARSR